MNRELTAESPDFILVAWREEKGREKSSGVGLPTFYPCPPPTFLRVSVCLILNGCPWLIGLPRSPVTPPERWGRKPRDSGHAWFSRDLQSSKSELLEGGSWTLLGGQENLL